MANPLQYCKVISLQLIKINEKKKKKTIEKRHRRKQYREDADVNLGQSELWPSFYTVAH